MSVLECINTTDFLWGISIKYVRRQPGVPRLCYAMILHLRCASVWKWLPIMLISQWWAAAGMQLIDPRIVQCRSSSRKMQLTDSCGICWAGGACGSQRAPYACVLGAQRCPPAQPPQSYPHQTDI